MKSENKNFLLNIVYQGLTLVFPLVTVPYISRSLGVEGIGVYSYTYSIAYMFMLVGMLGINNYGNRSIARVRDDRGELSRTFCSIYAFQLIINLAAVVAYCAYILVLQPQYGIIDWIQLIYVVSICFDVNWFFFGLEKFKLTIVRNLMIKVASLVFILLLVRSESDLWLYTLIMAGSTFASQLYLFILLPRYVCLVMPRPREVLSHGKEVLVLFVPVLAFSIYRVMDKTMIGAMASVEELGYFENAEKIINIPVAVISALGTVMLPRMSYILADPKADYKKTIRESMQLALMLSTAMAAGLIVISGDAAEVLFGPGFEKSGVTISLLAVTVVASAWSNVVRTQYLIPRGLDSVYVGSTIGAAVLNLAINIFAIPRWGAYGACVGTIAAECFIVIFQSVTTRKELENGCYVRLLCGNLLSSLVMALVALIAIHQFEGHLVRLAVATCAFVAVFLCFNGRYLLVDFFGVKLPFKRRR